MQNIRTYMNKKFDCVEMKHKAAKQIQSQITGLSAKEELAQLRQLAL